jgi:uroporphyrinogen decarboxylase
MYITDGDAIACAQLALQRRVGHDILVTAADTYYIAEGFGLATTHYADALPTSDGPLLKDLKDADRLRIPDPERDGRMPVYLQAVRSLVRSVGGSIAIRGTGTGPFSLAAYLYGDQNFLLALAEIDAGIAPVEDEKRLRQLLHLCAEASARFISAQINSGENIAYMGDSLSSMDMISPEMYRAWALPYQREVFQLIDRDLRRSGAKTLLHICGDNRGILKDMAATGADILEIDHKMDLAECRALLGPTPCLIGNLDPVQTILQGDADKVRAESRACIEALGARNFILGTGCFVPRDSPVDNLKAMTDAAHAYAR